jgi:chromate transporter
MQEPDKQSGAPHGPAPTALQLFQVFAKIGLTSFGGGLSGWILRELVQTRAWISEEDFLSGLALAQAFPGVNVVNLAIWLGYRLRGTWGALVSMFGIIVPPAFVVVGIASVFASLSAFPMTHLVLDGVGAAAVGLSLSMGVLAARRAAAKGVVPVVIMVVAFIAVGVVKLSMPLVVVVLGPISVAAAYRRLTHA